MNCLEDRKEPRMRTSHEWQRRSATHLIWSFTPACHHSIVRQKNQKTMSTHDNWPFDQPRNCAVMTTRQVMNQIEPILAVYHDEDDDGWQFIGASDASESNGCVISLQEAVDLDPTVAEVADMLPGWFASRPDAKSLWQRHRNPRPLEDDPWGLDPGVTPKSIGGAMFQSIARLFRSK